MIDYEVRLERCKREDTKELMIQCMDKASIDNHNDQINEFISALELVGIIIIVVLFGGWILQKVFG